jgi:hypothetical protein
MNDLRQQKQSIVTTDLSFKAIDKSVGRTDRLDRLKQKQNFPVARFFGKTFLGIATPKVAALRVTTNSLGQKVVKFASLNSTR